jgi:hypothetical protein
MIYALAYLGDETGPVKVGFCKGVPGSHEALLALRARMKKISIGSPVPLVAVALAGGEMRDERELHRVWRSQRLDGEWFKREGAVIEFLATHACAPIHRNPIAQARAEGTQQTRGARMERGECPKCGGARAPGMVNCAACLEAVRQERARAKVEGRCIDCRQALASGETSRCSACRERSARRDRVDYAVNRGDILKAEKAKRMAKGMIRTYTCRVCGTSGCDARSHTAEEIGAAQTRDPKLRSFFCTVCGELGHNKRRHEREAVEVKASEVYIKRVLDTLSTLGRPVTRIELAKEARANTEGIRLATNALVAAGRVMEVDGRRMGTRLVQLKR